MPHNYFLADVHQLHPLERDLGAGMLALRMLYSSLCNSRRSYSTFLNSMNPCLLKSIRPLDVLYFWRQAAGIPEGTPWMAVFAVDVVCMATTEKTAFFVWRLHIAFVLLA